MHDRSPTPVGGDLYETAFIGNFNPGDRGDCSQSASQPAIQPDNDESSQDSPVTPMEGERNNVSEVICGAMACRCMSHMCTGI